MRTSEIKDFVSQLERVKKPRTILVDGPWGCGKTTQALRCITDFDARPSSKRSEDKVITREIFYISVFGFSSVDEMRKALVETQHSKAKAIGKKCISVFRMVTPFVCNVVGAFLPLPAPIQEAFKKTPDIAEALLDTYTKDQKRDVIIIIDDVERAQAGVKPMDILGFIDSLKACGDSVLCLGNSAKFHDPKETERWDEFKEKCFDRECIIDEIDTEIISTITGAKDPGTIAAIQKIIEKNYRTAERAIFLADSIEDELNKAVKSGDVTKKCTKEELLVNCTICCRAASGDDKGKYDSPEAALDKNIKTYEENEWSEYKRLFGEKTANNLSHFLHDKKCRLKQQNDAYLAGIMEFYYYNHKDALRSLLATTEQAEIAASKETKKQIHPFFLGDAKRQELKESFINSLKDGTVLNTPDLGWSTFKNLLSLPGGFLTQEDMDLYFDTTIDCFMDRDDLTKELRNAATFDTSGGKLRGFYKKAKITEEKAKDSRRAERLAKYKSNGMYHSMADLVYEVGEDYKASRFTDYSIAQLTKNAFLLPDITDDISEPAWSYVHYLCGLAEDGVLPKKTLLDALSRQLEINKTVCGKERVQLLTEQYHLNDEQ